VLPTSKDTKGAVLEPGAELASWRMVLSGPRQHFTEHLLGAGH
jgi:hypothetical protein